MNYYNNNHSSCGCGHKDKEKWINFQGKVCYYPEEIYDDKNYDDRNDNEKYYMNNQDRCEWPKRDYCEKEEMKDSEEYYDERNTVDSRDIRRGHCDHREYKKDFIREEKNFEFEKEKRKCENRCGRCCFCNIFRSFSRW